MTQPVVSHEQAEMLIARFNELDVEKSGKLSREITGEILQQEGTEFEGLLVALLFEKYDHNTNGYIELNEFISFCREIETFNEAELVSQVFRIADTDNNGYLDVDEVKRIGNLMGLDVTLSDAWATIFAMDRNHDNVIDLNEFMAVVRG